MLWSASLAFGLIIACLPVLFAPNPKNLLNYGKGTGADPLLGQNDAGILAGKQANEPKIGEKPDNGDKAGIVKGDQWLPYPKGYSAPDVYVPKKAWPWKQFGAGALVGAVGGAAGAGALGYYYGKKAGRLEAASGQSPAPGNETKTPKNEDDKGSPIWQLLVYVLASISAILLLIICVGVFAWFCTIDVEADEKERSQKSRKSGKSKRASVKTPNSQTPSTIETLGSTPVATSERVGSRKKSVKSQMNPTYSPAPVTTPTSALHSGVNSGKPSKQPSARRSSGASSRLSVLSAYSSSAAQQGSAQKR